MGNKQNLPSWAYVKRNIKPFFLQAGITSCELGWEGCTGSFATTFAHSLRRRHIQTPSEMEEVIVACQSCHSKLDAQGEEPAREMVLRTIANRRRRVEKLYKEERH